MATDGGNKHSIGNVTLRNIHFVKPIANPAPEITGISSLTIEGLHIGGQKITSRGECGIPAEMNRVPLIRRYQLTNNKLYSLY